MRPRSAIYFVDASLIFVIFIEKKIVIQGVTILLDWMLFRKEL